MESDSSQLDVTAPRIPTWQIVCVLVGFPMLYMANSFTPWSYGLFVEGDHRYFLAFGASVVVLHWASVFAAVFFTVKNGGKLADVGFDLKPIGLFVFLAVVVGTGLFFIWLRMTWPASDLTKPEQWQLFYPWTRTERLFGVLLYLSAGFCEEFVYRGWAIRTLQARGMKTWQAVSLATLSFVFLHGVAAFFMFPFLIVAGVFFSLLFVWTKRLSPGIYVHALFDMLCILAV